MDGKPFCKHERTEEKGQVLDKDLFYHTRHNEKGHTTYSQSLEQQRILLSVL